MPVRTTRSKRTEKKDGATRLQEWSKKRCGGARNIVAWFFLVR
jgi:hypothetical protein